MTALHIGNVLHVLVQVHRCMRGAVSCASQGKDACMSCSARRGKQRCLNTVHCHEQRLLTARCDEGTPIGGPGPCTQHAALGTRTGATLCGPSACVVRSCAPFVPPFALSKPVLLLVMTACTTASPPQPSCRSSIICDIDSVVVMTATSAAGEMRAY